MILLIGVALPVIVIGGRAAQAGSPGGRVLDRPGIFTDVTETAGVDMGHTLYRPARDGDDDRLSPWDYVGTGQAWGDYDNDGWVDLYLTDQLGPNRLFRNAGDGGFEPAAVTDEVALEDEESAGAIFVDVDNDGWRDLFVATRSGGVLLRNTEGRGFQRVDDAGLATDAAAVMGAFADFDGDSLLDLFLVTNECFSCSGVRPGDGGSNRLFKNVGGGRFEDRTELLPEHAVEAFTMVSIWFDADGDNDPDLYVANDTRSKEFLPKNVLLRNDGAGCGGWCFTDISASGAGIRKASMGVAIGDYDRNGHLDLNVTSIGFRNFLAGPSALLANSGDGAFAQPKDSGAVVDAFSWGTAFLDVDNDGWLDLYTGVGDGDPAVSYYSERVQRDRLHLGTPDGEFVEVTDYSGTSDPLPTMGLSTGDFNRDGWLDLLVGNFDHGYLLYANAGVYGEDNHRFVAELRGGGPVNRDAVGTRITVETSDGTRQTGEVVAGSSLGSGNELIQHFGLGDSRIERVTVAWPDGTVQTFDGVPTDVRWSLAYGGTPEIEPLLSADVPRELAVSAPSSSLGSIGLAIPALTVLTTLGLIVFFFVHRFVGGRLTAETLKVLVLWSVSFQVVHFAEHVIQMGYWLVHPSRPLFITPWGRDATNGFAQLAGARGGQTTGTELLHLSGNWIFLAGLTAAMVTIRRHGIGGRASTALMIAFGAQLFHVVEHVALTTTWLVGGRPIGVSTLFGQSYLLGGSWAASFRGWAHFVLNLVPTITAVVGVVLFDFRRAIPTAVRVRMMRGRGWILPDALLAGILVGFAYHVVAVVLGSSDGWSQTRPLAVSAGLVTVLAGVAVGLYRHDRDGRRALLRDLAATAALASVGGGVATLVAGVGRWWLTVPFVLTAGALLGVARWAWTLRSGGGLLVADPAADPVEGPPSRDDALVPT